MPNWCNNNITIRGPKAKLDKILEASKEQGLLDHFMPMPTELKETTADGSTRPELEKKYGFSDWYGWANNNWGTKWNVMKADFYDEDPKVELTADENYEASLSFVFDTAWAPPLGAYENYLAENEDVTIKAHYFEGGMDFMGVWEDYDDDCYTISEVSDDDFETDTILRELDDFYNILESRAMYREEQKEEEAVNG